MLWIKALVFADNILTVVLVAEVLLVLRDVCKSLGTTAKQACQRFLELVLVETGVVLLARHIVIIRNQVRG